MLAKAQQTIDTIANIFRQGWIVTVGLSGKDSFCVAHCAIEALKLVRESQPHVGPLYIVNTNTTLDNFELHNFILELQDEAVRYAGEFNLPIICENLTPSLGKLPMVEYIGRGKLLRTPATSSNGRDCAVDWKVLPMKRFLESLKREHQTTKIVSMSGSRSAESTVRAGNIEKRGETETEIVRTDLGFTLAPIKSWSLSDVWALVAGVNSDDFDSFAWRKADGLRKHYAAGNGGTCDLFAVDTKKTDKACGARFGCTLCAMVENDNSLQAQIDVAPERYGYMQPMVGLRQFMINTLYDYERSRSLVGRELKSDGSVKIGYNQYSVSYRKELLRYVLTIDAQEIEAGDAAVGGYRFQLIDYKTLLMIQYHWSREGGEAICGEALRIWHEVHTDGARFPIPPTEFVEKANLPPYRWLDVNTAIHEAGATGLWCEGDEQSDVSARKMMFRKDGETHYTVPFEEAASFSIDGERAHNFVEFWWPDVGAQAYGEGKCPSTMVKLLLASDIIRLRKGSIAKLNNELKRAQTYNAMRYVWKTEYETMCVRLSEADRPVRQAVVPEAQGSLAF